MSNNSKVCYQVKLHSKISSELKSLYNQLGSGVFTISVTSTFDESLNVPVLNPQIIRIDFDECDPCDVLFTLYIELPYVLLVNPQVDINPQDNIPDSSVLPVEFQIGTSSQLNSISITKFTIYPLPEDVSSRGYETKCYRYYITRISCICPNGRCPCEIASPTKFKIIFPLSREVACLIPEFGLSGFYLKNLISSNLKTKVRLVPSSITPAKDSGRIPAGLLSYDAKTCTALLEFDQSEYSSIITGYEYLFNYNFLNPANPPTLQDMAMLRRYEVRGVSKCTEKTLLTFDVCFDPSLLTSNNCVTNYTIVAHLKCGGDYCFEFENIPIVPAPTTTTTTAAPETTTTTTAAPETTTTTTLPPIQ